MGIVQPQVTKLFTVNVEVRTGHDSKCQTHGVYISLRNIWYCRDKLQINT